jgi:hypothetical protein
LGLVNHLTDRRNTKEKGNKEAPPVAGGICEAYHLSASLTKIWEVAITFSATNVIIEVKVSWAEL